MSESQDVGLVLKRLREGAGLTQQQLANELGVQQPAVARWESGGVKMSVNRIEELLEYFGYGLEYDITAVPYDEALRDGVPLRMARRRSGALRRQTGELEVSSAGYEFRVDSESPWIVEMRHLATGRRVPGGVGLYPERVTEMAPHPDGALIRAAATVGKIVPSAKASPQGDLVFAFMLADQKDLRLAGVADDARWKL